MAFCLEANVGQSAMDARRSFLVPWPSPEFLAPLFFFLFCFSLESVFFKDGCWVVSDPLVWAGFYLLFKIGVDS